MDKRINDKTNMTSTPLPRSVALLGYGGLIPFIACSLVGLLIPQEIETAQYMLFTYGAVILSFVGALHWGFAMTVPALADHTRRNYFIWSVIPSLLAWFSLMLPSIATATLLIIGFTAHYWRDRRIAPWCDLPTWYLPLRTRLTVIACLSLALGASLNPGI